MPERSVAEALVEALAGVPGPAGAGRPRRRGARRAARRAARARRRGRRASRSTRPSPSRSRTTRATAAAAAPTTSPSPRLHRALLRRGRRRARCAGPRLVSIGPVTSDDAARARARARPRGRTRTTSTAWSPRSSVTRRCDDADRSPSSPTTGRRRLRRRLPRGDRAPLPGGARHRPHPRRRRARRAPGRARAAHALPYLPAGVHLAVVDPGVGGAPAARSRCARARGPPARRPRQRPAVAGRRALRRRGGGGRHRPLAVAAEPVSRHLPRARHLRAGGRAPGRRRAAGRGRRAARPGRARAGSSCRAPRGDDGALVAHVAGVDRFGNLQLDASTQRARAVGVGSARGAPSAPARIARSSGARSPTSRRASCSSTRTPSGTLALAVNRGTAAAALGARAAATSVAAASRARRSARRGCTCAATDSTNARARELAPAGAPHGTLVTRRRADRGPRAPGPRLDRAARPRRCCCRWSCATSDALLPLRAGPRRGRRRRRRQRASSGPTTCWLDGPQGRRHPGRGPPQEGWAVLGIGVNVAATPGFVAAGVGDLGPPAGFAGGDADAGCCARSNCASRRAPRRRSRRCRIATRCRAARRAGRAAREWAPASALMAGACGWPTAPKCGLARARAPSPRPTLTLTVKAMSVSTIRRPRLDRGPYPLAGGLERVGVGRRLGRG